MCIRDRREYCAEWDIPVDVNGKLIVATSEAEVPRLDELETVSYTHLRAHETVLDLVCRLLLEKKKKTKSYNAITDRRTQKA